MWLRFTERARKVVWHAQEEAHKHGTEFVSTEHLLLGLLQEPESLAVRALVKIDVSPARIREEVEKEMQPVAPRRSPDMTLTPQAKRVIDLAWDESRSLRNNYIGTEHLLLGLLRRGEGLAARVLVRQGVEYEQVRLAIRELQRSSLEFLTFDMPVQRNPRSGRGFWRGLWDRLWGRREPSTEMDWPDDPVYLGRADKTGLQWLRFSEQARKVIIHAEEEAQKGGVDYLATEHLLLGILRKPESVAMRVLEKHGLNPDQIRAKVETQLPRPPKDQPNEVILTPRAERVLNLAYEEARGLDSRNLIGTGHLLLGLVREGDGVAGRTLDKLGVKLDRARLVVKELQADPEKL